MLLLLKKPITLISVFAVAIVTVVLINTTTTHANDCNAIVAMTNNEHKQALRDHKAGSHELLTALYKVEDALFDAMKGQCANSSAVVSSMGDLQLSLGQIPIAQLYAAKALKMDSDNWQAHYVIGSALNLEKKYSEGLVHLQKASALQPDNHSLRVNLCSSYNKNKRYDEAIEACSTAIEKGPYDIRGIAHYLRAEAYKGTNELTLAEKELELAREFGYIR